MSKHRPFAQLRIGGKAFNPARDIVNLFPALVQNTALSFAHVGWPGAEFRKMAADHGLQPDALARAPETLARFMNEAMSGRYDSYEAVWIGCGFDKLPAPVRLAMFTHLGGVLMRAYFECARPANPSGYRPEGSDSATEATDRAAWALEADLPHVAERRRAEVERAADAGDE